MYDQNGLNDDRHAAERFWQQRLKGQNITETPQHAACAFSIVVPVNNERTERLAKQVDSLLNQEGIAPEEFEVLYVINNAPPDGGAELAAATQANQNLIAYLQALKISNVHIIDCSSPGCEIPDCNVGRARNRGIAEASWRFHRSNQNGLLIQTDADSYFEDSSYLFRLKQIFSAEPSLIGMAGGLIFEFSPDTDHPEEMMALQSKLSLFELQQRWLYLEYWLQQIAEGNGWNLPLHFSGAHMISRSLETACIGGLQDLAGGSDPLFGAALIDYAQQHNKQVIDGRDEWQVVTALRESFRTASSFGPAFRNIDPLSPPRGTDLVSFIHALESGENPRSRPASIPISWDAYQQAEAAVSRLPNGMAMIHRLENMASRLNCGPFHGGRTLWHRLSEWLRRKLK